MAINLINQHFHVNKIKMAVYFSIIKTNVNYAVPHII